MITKTRSSIDFTLNNFNKHIEKKNSTKNLRINPNLTPRKIRKLNLVESENNSNLTLNKTKSKNDLEICSLEYSRFKSFSSVFKC
jgi:hypothetical protein